MDLHSHLNSEGARGAEVKAAMGTSSGPLKRPLIGLLLLVLVVVLLVFVTLGATFEEGDDDGRERDTAYDGAAGWAYKGRHSQTSGNPDEAKDKSE